MLRACTSNPDYYSTNFSPAPPSPHAPEDSTINLKILMLVASCFCGNLVWERPDYKRWVTNWNEAKVIVGTCAKEHWSWSLWHGLFGHICGCLYAKESNKRNRGRGQKLLSRFDQQGWYPALALQTKFLNNHFLMRRRDKDNTFSNKAVKFRGAVFVLFWN